MRRPPPGRSGWRPHHTHNALAHKPSPPSPRTGRGSCPVRAGPCPSRPRDKPRPERYTGRQPEPVRREKMAMKLEVLHNLPAATSPATRPILSSTEPIAAPGSGGDRCYALFRQARCTPATPYPCAGRRGSDGILALGESGVRICRRTSPQAAADIRRRGLFSSAIPWVVCWSRHYMSAASGQGGSSAVQPCAQRLGSSAMHMSMFSPDVLWQLSLLQKPGGRRRFTPEISTAGLFRATRRLSNRSAS